MSQKVAWPWRKARLGDNWAATRPTAPEWGGGSGSSRFCVRLMPENEAYVERYQRDLGGVARRDGAAHVFGLKQSCVRLIPASWLGDFLPGETASALPAFVAYAVAVRDLGRARQWLEDNGFPVNAEASGGIFVPSKAALGAAAIFRQAGSPRKEYSRSCDHEG